MKSKPGSRSAKVSFCKDVDEPTGQE